MHSNQISTLSMALAISVATIGTPGPFVSAQEMTTFESPLVISQRYRERRTLRAVSGPDERGRWRFNQPSDVSDDAMRSQGCVNVGNRNAQPWRCPSDRIRVEIYDRDNDNRYDTNRYDRRTLRAVSGPDERGRWRYNQPEGISDDAMRSQGCVNVGNRNAQPWRCPSDRIRVEVYDRDDRDGDRDRYDSDRYDRDRYERRTLRAVSGPDDRGRWRFNQPSDVPDDAMEAEGCVNVGNRNAQPWRCPSDRIRVEVYRR